MSDIAWLCFYGSTFWVSLPLYLCIEFLQHFSLQYSWLFLHFYNYIATYAYPTGLCIWAQLTIQSLCVCPCKHFQIHLAQEALPSRISPLSERNRILCPYSHSIASHHLSGKSHHRPKVEFLAECKLLKRVLS